MLHLRNYRLTALVLLYGVLLLSLFLLASGCTRGEKTTPVPYGPITDPEQQGIVEAWDGTRHADTYVLGTEGLNNKCARCHSPFNWKPTDKADLPASCQSCIIPFSLSEPTEPVLEEDWNSVECNVCHIVAGGSAASQVSFLDMMNTMPGQTDEETGLQILKYASVSTNTELCEKCHMDRDTFLYGRDLDPAHADTQCTDCHDAHSLEASCDDCHAEPVTGIVCE